MLNVDTLLQLVIEPMVGLIDKQVYVRMMIGAEPGSCYQHASKKSLGYIFMRRQVKHIP